MNEQQLLHYRIENNLNMLFDKECPLPEKYLITPLADKTEIMTEFKKWIDFWNSKRPTLNDPNMVFDKKTNLLIMKMGICDMKIMNFLNQLEEMGYRKEFLEKYK